MYFLEKNVKNTTNITSDNKMDENDIQKIPLNRCTSFKCHLDNISDH